MRATQPLRFVMAVSVLVALFWPSRIGAQKNQVMGELKFSGATKIERDAGVWIVFVDDAYIGHASDFGGAFHSMLVTPGKRRVKVDLPGYRTFETELNVLPGQKAEVKTELAKGSIEQAGELVKQR